MQEAIAQFKMHLERRYPGRSTTKHYMSDLRVFQAFVGEKSPQAITAKTIDDFVQYQSDQGLKAATINRRLSTLSSFFEFLIGDSEGEYVSNPVHWKRHSIRPGHRLPRDVSDETVTRLFSAIKDSRDRAMYTLMVGAGLRVGEVVTLKVHDLQPVEASALTRLRVRGKGDKERMVWLTAETLRQVQAWLQERPQTQEAALFLNQHGRPLSVAGVQFRLKQYCDQAAVYLTCHQLRHTFARRLAEQSMPIDSLAKLLGHRNLQTTQGYIDGADPTVRLDFQRAMSRLNDLFSPPATPTLDSAVVPPLAPAQADERPDAQELLAQVAHLAADLPDWLQGELRLHTLRRIPRWQPHRAKAQTHMHFGTLCRICRWLVTHRHWQLLDQLQRTDLVAYVHARQVEGLKPRSIGAELTIFRMFWRDLLAQERVSNSALLHVQAPVAEDLLPRYLTASEFQRLEQVVLTETAAGTPQDRFDRTWFYLLAHTGIRISELLNLRLVDCDLNGKRLRIQAGKGNRDRMVPLTDHLVVCLQAYLVGREPAATDHLLIYQGAAVKAHLVPDRLRRFGAKAQIDPLSPHRLRHTLATFLVNQGMSIVSLQKFLGHQDINKTLIYARVHDETVRTQFATAMAQIESIAVTNWPSQLSQLFSSAPFTAHTNDLV